MKKYIILFFMLMMIPIIDAQDFTLSNGIKCQGNVRMNVVPYNNYTIFGMRDCTFDGKYWNCECNKQINLITDNADSFNIIYDYYTKQFIEYNSTTESHSAVDIKNLNNKIVKSVRLVTKASNGTSMSYVLESNNSYILNIVLIIIGIVSIIGIIGFSIYLHSSKYNNVSEYDVNKFLNDTYAKRK